MPEQNPILVIGGGAAGMIAAWRASSLGANVLLLERNKKLGIKLLISGGGKCNITHAGPMEEVRAAFVPREARFLKPAFYRFSNDDIVNMIEARGVATYARESGRIFPVSGNADDVVGALISYLHSEHVEVKLNTRVEKVFSIECFVTGVRLADGVVQSSHIVLATGGASYQKTGTSGDGFRWAEQLGHTIVPIRPALAPIGITPKLPDDWRGIALRGGCLMVFSNDKKVFEWKDDILFSHEGITGPAALECSRIAAELMTTQRVELRFDFLPTSELNELDEELRRFILAHRDKMIATLMERWLPKRMSSPLVRAIGVEPTKRGHVVTRDERRRLAQLLKSWKIGEVGTINIDRGEVTAGGIALDEVDPKTMRSRKVNGLYLCGEVLDIAGPVGGYNLQAAFSTGSVAGETAANDWQKGITK